MENTELKILVAEVRRLKRRNSVVTLFLAVGFVLFIFERNAVAEPSAEGVPEMLKGKVVQAGRFQLVDESGVVRAAIRFNDDLKSPMFVLFDSSGHPRGGIALNGDGHPLLSFQDEKKVQRLRIYVGPDREGKVELLDSIGNAQVEMAGGTPRVVLRDATSKASAVLQASENDVSLTLDDSDNGAGILARTGKKFGTSVDVFNKDGKRTLRPIDPK